ncbi:MAG: DUF3048 domain-containing protein [Acidimicrobiales bacterium]|nr:DUF3048 domain-containing protein [Acidimicrobiales bacterium]MCB9394492.1 DUF3048 domain-containing protein [Acidimicrobiaceae bacterium]
MLASVLAACGGGDDDAAPTTTEAPATTTTEAPEPTTSSTDAPTTTEGEAPSTTEADPTTGPIMPLTGLPLTDEVLAARPAMVVKIDNHPQARPQFGLNGADIVFEENVENLTRFAAVFQTNAPAKVGPVRSGRTQDVDLLASFDEPLFVWSGGNPSVTRAISSSTLVSLSPTTTRNVGFFRDRRGNEDSEHTLYVDTIELYSAFTPIFNPPPSQQFEYRAPDEAFNGEAASGVEIEMDGVDVTWTWDAAIAGYVREQGGRPHETDFGQVNAANVVVLEVDYRPSPADSRSPEAQTIGTGSALVFTGGALIRGTWTRAEAAEPFQLVDDNGSVIALTPGRTWVELPRTGRTTPLD